MMEDRGTRFRCGAANVEVHHMITRARGGSILDEEGETYHLLALCYIHHKWAHDAGAGDLILPGYVYRENATGEVVYVGPDEYLSGKYPKAA